MNYLKISSFNEEVYQSAFKNIPRRLTPSKVPEKYIRWLKQAHKKWVKQTSIYHNFDVVFVGGVSKYLGHYVIGTYQQPFILLYIDTIEDDAYVDTLEATFKIVVYHELAHAMCQYHRKLNFRTVHPSKEEKFVEMFSRRMHYNHPLQKEAYQMIYAIQSQK